MKSRLLRTLPGLSLLLCAATAGVAVRGQLGGGGTFGLQNDRVSWRFTWRDAYLYSYACPGTVTQFALHGRGFALAGVRCAWDRDPGGVPIVAASVPQPYVWGLALLAGVAPALALRRRMRARRGPPRGACARCGYDLRATPEQCPECGMTTAAVAPAAPG